MKKVLFYTMAFAMLVGLSNCKKDSSEPGNTVPDDPSQLLIYQAPGFSRETKSDQLQATVKKTDLQFSTFGDLESASSLGSFKKAYVYNTAENTESFVLFDEMGEPAFLYKIDMATGKKKESVVEFQRIDQNNFYVRFFYYDWTNRLGTLLFETMITGSNGSYQSQPSYVIENMNFGSKSVATGPKTNTSFPVKISRLDKYMNPDYQGAQTRSVNDGIDDWMNSFTQMKNSSISDWLVTTRKAGVVLTLTGLGLSETVVGAPVGVWLLAGGGCLVATSTAIEVVITDKWSNFLTETKSKLDALSETATEIAGNTVQKFQGYAHDLKDHWVNTNTTKTSLDELTDEIEQEELLVNKDDLNDLPDKNGVLQIGLSWDQDQTDIDLWVTDPAGEKIYYGNPNSASGGYLDRDDTDGYGPENIYWASNIPDGEYLIQVHYFSGEPVTNYEVKITNGLGYSAVYNGTLQSADQLDNVVTITKSGSLIGKK